MNKIYFGDAETITRDHIDDSSVHLVIVSPPWTTYRTHGVIGDFDVLNKDTYSGRILSATKEFYRTLVDGGFLLIQGGQFFIPSDMRVRHRVINLPSLFYSIITDNTDLEYRGTIHYYNKYDLKWKIRPGSYPYPLSVPIPTHIEDILIFSKKGKRKVSAKMKLGSSLNKKDLAEFGNPLWEFDEPIDRYISPIELMRRLIKFYSYKGDIVFDPFVGTGTIMIAAMELGRQCIGIEIDTSLQSAICDRLDNSNLLSNVEFWNYGTTDKAV